MGRLFGTDGVRGVANEDLTPELALALGGAAGQVLRGEGPVVLGRDTRLSGPMLEAAVVAGLTSAGVDVGLAGITPTPAVAYLARTETTRGGVVISASHNPVPDNGIKFFSAAGTKIEDELEEEIERLITEPRVSRPVGGSVGRSAPLPHAQDHYVDHLLMSVEEALSGLRVVVDCAFGAAWQVGPRAFREAGAEVIALNAEPDGNRINVDCGSTNPGQLRDAVTREGADLGIAFDGDADRVIAVDERGGVVDGDRMIGVIALELLRDGRLKNNVVVATVMANLGFRKALETHGIEVVTAAVGDRFVAQEMAQRDAVIGGEQSGHIIFSEYSPTGDGILTGLQLMQTLVRSDQTLSSVAHFFEPFPQVLINVPVKSRTALEQSESLAEEVARAEARLGSSGRVLLRASGTEPLVRVMVEAEDEALAQELAVSLAEATERLLA